MVSQLSDATTLNCHIGKLIDTTCNVFWNNGCCLCQILQNSTLIYIEIRKLNTAKTACKSKFIFYLYC